jgi:hypothetical protein
MQVRHPAGADEAVSDFECLCLWLVDADGPGLRPKAYLSRAQARVRRQHGGRLLWMQANAWGGFLELVASIDSKAEGQQ